VPQVVRLELVPCTAIYSILFFFFENLEVPDTWLSSCAQFASTSSILLLAFVDEEKEEEERPRQQQQKK
jgi:hypothetical protein